MKTAVMQCESPTPPADAIELLRADHAAVKIFFSDYAKLCFIGADNIEDRGIVATQICDALTVHSQIEEEIFYPALRAALDAKYLVNDAEIEHDLTRDLVYQLAAMSPGEKRFDETVSMLADHVIYHMADEERLLFEEAQKSDLDMAALGNKLIDRRNELRGELGLEAQGDAEKANWASGNILDDEVGTEPYLAAYPSAAT